MPKTRSSETNNVPGRRTPSHIAGRRSLRNSLFRAGIFVAVFAGLALSFAVRRPESTTAQSQRRQEIPESASFVEAKRAGFDLSGGVVARQDEQVAQPEGGDCSWSAGPVYSINILDQAVVNHNGTIYAFGGVSTSITANSFKFDGMAWTPIAPLPIALEFPAAVSNGTFIYILGGAEATAGTPQTSLYRYDTVANSYTPLTSFSTGTWNHAAVHLNGKIYKWAGTGPATNSTNVLEIYDIAGNSWTTGAVYPLSTSFVSAFVQGGFIYSAGGITSPGSAANLKTFRYDPMANTWDDAAIADLPLTRWGAASSLTAYGSNNGWVLAGGYVNGVLAANISNTAIRWNPTTNSWATLPNMPSDRARLNGAILGSNFHAIGGRSQASPGFVGANSNHRFNCIPNVAVISNQPPTIIAESCPTPVGAPDPGEDLGVSLFVQNNGDIPTTNLTITLQPTGGVTNAPPPQVYGALAPGAAAVERIFNFTVDPNLACDATLVLTFTVSDGAMNYPNITRTFPTGGLTVTQAQNFDGVVAPALPAGWTTVQLIGTGINWVTSTTTPNSAPNTAFANDPSGANLSALISPATMVQSSTGQLSFRNNFITENTFDGMVLEFTTNGGGTWTDIITGGGSFVSGGYNGVLSTTDMNPLPGRNAWTGNSGGYITTLINLPASLAGQTVQFRWLMGSDAIVASTGVRVDDVQIFGQRTCNDCGGPVGRARADFDGDGRSDVSVFRPSDSTWYLLRSTAGFTGVTFGASGDKIVPGDYDGDGRTDIAVLRGGSTWYLLQSTAGFAGIIFGSSGDLPVAADYDGDGKTDTAVYRPSSSTWYVLRSSDGSFFGADWGVPGDIPITGDFDGDGKADLTVFRPSGGLWISNLSGGGTRTTTWGLSGDKPVPADYDGDEKIDLAVFRGGNWYILNSNGGSVVSMTWGLGTDKAVPADYDGDGRDDIAVFRDGTWYIFGSGPGLAPGAISVVSFGLAGDGPVPAGYVPEQ